MSHYFDQNPQVDHQMAELQVRLRGQDFRFITDRGVFSRQHLDFGSTLLIETVNDEVKRPSGRMLDLGCGYGPVGIVMKRLYPSLEVVLCDINARALELARANARLNNVQYLEIIRSDGIQSVTGMFDLILTNPPIRAGKLVVYRFFSEAASRLRPNGCLYVVIQKKQGAPSAFRELQRLFREVETIEHQGGYWVIRAASPAEDTIAPTEAGDA
jgi:16S rRNA (guanine1207-N2)-methyltransferase